LVQIEKKFAWSFLGFLLAVIFGSIAVYTEFIRDTSPVISYEIVSSTRVLDVKEDVGDLSIIYNNEDIRKSKKVLSVLIVRVINNGKSPVLKTYYDDVDKMGLLVENGDIIRGEIVSASTEYLRKNAGISFSNPRNAEFTNVIIEPKDYYDAKFLILIPEDKALTVFPKGKIAGVKQITMFDRISNQNADSFWKRTTSGPILVQITRVPVYFFGFILLMGFIVVPIIIISEYFEKRKRRRIVRHFETFSDCKYKENNDKVYSYYIENGLNTLLKTKNAVVNQEKFDKFMNAYKKKGVNFEDLDDVDLDPSVQIAMRALPNEINRGLSPADILRILVNIGVVAKEDDTIIRNEEHVKSMVEFLDFAAIKEA